MSMSLQIGTVVPNALRSSARPHEWTRASRFLLLLPVASPVEVMERQYTGVVLSSLALTVAGVVAAAMYSRGTDASERYTFGNAVRS